MPYLWRRKLQTNRRVKGCGDSSAACSGLAMTVSGADREPRIGKGAATLRAVVWRCRSLAGGVFATIAITGLADCSGGVGTLMVDPGQYTAYHCDQLATQQKSLNVRETQLRDLILRASEGGGGTVIGALAYRTDYENVLAQEKLLRREAAEKKCSLEPTYTSDQTIR